MANSQEIDLTSLVSRMQSPNMEVQGPALVAAAQVTRTLTAEAVSALIRSSSRGVAAEQLATFGSLVPLLQDLVAATEQDLEARAFAATLLLHFGSRFGAEQLMNMLRSREGPMVHIANWLGKAGVVESREVILDLIKEWNFRDDLPGGCTLLDSFRSLGGAIPSVVSTKINGELDEPYRAAVAKLMEPPAMT